MPDFGDGSPREQYGEVDQYAPSLANGGISPAQWAEYQAKRRRDAILGTLLSVGGMLGAQPLANALGIGASGAGAAGAAGSASVPGAVGASSAPLGGGTVTGGALSATPFTSLAPYAGTVAASGTGAGAAAGGGAGAGTLFAGMSGRDLAGLGLGLGSAVGGAMSNRNTNMSPTSATGDPAMQELLALMSGRLRKSEPLYDSVLNMANGLLPTQYQKGGGGMG